MTLLVRQEKNGWGAARARAVAVVLGVMFVFIVGRTTQVALSGGGETRATAGVEQTVRRADIIDRNGDLLATSVPAWSLAADPRAVWDGAETAEALATVLPGIDVADLTRRLSDKSRRFEWVQRGLTPRQREAVFELGLEGLRFHEEMRRVYPGGRLAGHLLGFTDVDGKGVEGIEHAFDAKLVEGGEALRLTLDAGVQFALETELDRAAEDFDMIGAAGVVLDARTGAVRALASWPAIDPNAPASRAAEARTNRATSAVFELGSIYKPLTVAMALETGAIDGSETYDVSQPLKVGTATVRDLHLLPHASAVTARDILAYSSNIGTVKIAQRAGVEVQRDFLTRFGLLDRTDAGGFPVAAPLRPARWDEVTAATVSYGHGVAVTPLTFAVAFSAFANGGSWLPPRLVEGAAEPHVVMSADTAARVTAMMRETVRVGSGRLADVSGYEVAGKTGTAEKPGPNGYDPERNITSFAAVFPASRPQFVVLVVLDEARPKIGDARTASTTATAVAGRLIARAAPMLDVEPVLGASAGPVRAEDPPPAGDVEGEAGNEAAPELRTARESRAL